MATSPMPLPPEPTPEQLFLAHLPHIKGVAAHTCRRYGFRREETEDFVAIVQLKIIEDDYAVIRKHKGKSTLKTYLTMVVQNLFRDHLNHLLGKWRPSAEAERLGDLAIQLDQMLHRDGRTLDEACEILLTNHHVEASRQELEALAAKLPRRTPRRRMESEEAVENRPAETMTPDQEAEAKESAARKRRVLKLLKDAMRKLPPEDSLLAQMSCEFKISQIARTLHIEQKPLYRRLDKIFETLREDLEGHGVRPEEIGGLFSTPEDDHEPRE